MWPPTARGLIHDFEPRLSARELDHIPVGPFQAFGVVPGGGARHLSVHAQVYASLPRLTASPDQERHVPPLDHERLGSQHTRGRVPAQERIHQMFSEMTGHRLLIRQGARGRFGAERVSFDRPLAIPILEVLEQDFGTLRDRFLGGSGFRCGVDQGQTRLAQQAVASLAHAGLAAAQADAVFQPAGDLDLDRFLAGIGHRVTHRGDGQ